MLFRSVRVPGGAGPGQGGPGAGARGRAWASAAGRDLARRPPELRPRGVVSVMSPQLTSCQVGWRESSAGGFRRAELARREVGWIVLR